MSAFKRFCRSVRGPLAALLCAAWWVHACAESFPERTVKIIVGQGAGATSDIIARLVAARLAELWSVPVVVEQHAGAAGTIAASMVAKSPGDGYTLLLASSTNLAMVVATADSLAYDPVKDFAPIGRIATIPWVLAARAKLPVQSVAELAAFSKAHPGVLKASSTGPGSVAGFGIDILNVKLGMDVLNVPYRTPAAQNHAVVAEEVDFTFGDTSVLAPQVKAGAVKFLAAAGSKRLRAFPDLATMGEQGVPEIVFEPWYGLAAPAETPTPILAKLHDGLIRALRTPEIKAQLLSFGYEPIEETPAEFARAINDDIARFSAAARKGEPKNAP
jgi:tripartite-type tricarboxylate transporter receptor subunit TctC